MTMLVSLDKSALFRHAPSIFAERPFDEMSAKYGFIPTYSVVEALRAEGWLAVRAQEQRTRIEEKRGFVRHMLRFRHAESLPALNEVHPEMVMLNSHDGTSAYQIHLGMYRLVCRNGMVVADSIFSALKVRHSKDAAVGVLEATETLTKAVPGVIDRVRVMRSITLTEREQRAFAESAIVARWGGIGDSPVTYDRVLRSRRMADQGASLWQTFNRVQENILRGGVVGRSHTGRIMHTREIKSVNEDVSLNKQLWNIAEQVIVQKAA